MSLERIKAILVQEYFLTRNSLEILMDVLLVPIITIIAFGYVSIFLTSQVAPPGGHYLFLGMLLWQILFLITYATSIVALWNIWWRNLSNIFITPISLTEFFLAQMGSSLLKAIFLFLCLSLIATVFFQFNILQLGIGNIVLFFINLALFAWAIGICVLGLIFRFGQRLQALAWGLIFLFQPLTATFFPLDVLPPFLQTVAKLFPPTYVFEAARQSLAAASVNWNFMVIAFLENVFYMIFAILFFNIMLSKSKETGQFARNEN